MEIKNYFVLEFPAKSENESFARVAVAALVAQLDPKLDQLTEIKTAVSEAVTNAIIHGYEHKEGTITLVCTIYTDRNVVIEIVDKGKGISNISKAMEPLFTTKPELERSGMGFTLMESFMDKVDVESSSDKGTKITLSKKLYDESN